MKKVISILLCAVMLFGFASVAIAAEKPAGFGEYKHVYIIGVDGSGAAWGMYDTPNFDRIFGEGAYRHNCHTENETISAQNWGSILTGVACEVHGFNNDNTADKLRYSDSDNGTVFRYVREAMPDAKLASIVHWHNINKGIIENDLGVNKIQRQSDLMVVDAIDNYFSLGNKPAVMFVQLDDVDHAGHTYGGQTEEYKNALIEADTHLGMIYDSIYKAGGMEDGLFILVADHGEKNGGGHGGHTVEEESAIVAISGKSVNKMTLADTVRSRDVAAITLHALGVEQPEHMTAVLPEGVFGDNHGVENTAGKTGLAGLWNKIKMFFIRLINLICAPFDFIVL